jgi:tetratricopeptide (TPR) repeat protein
MIGGMMIRRLAACIILTIAFNAKAFCQIGDTTGTVVDTSSISDDEMWDWLFYSGDDTLLAKNADTLSTLDQVRALMSQTNYDSASQVLDNYLEINGQDNEAWYLKGYINDKKENLPLAMQYYHKSIELDSTYWGPYRDLAYLFDVTAQYDSLNYYLKKTIQYSYHPDSFYYDYGYSFDALGKNDSALVYYHKALEGDPQDADAYLNIGAIWGSNYHLDSAEVYTLKAMEINPTYSRCCYNYAEILRSKGNAPKAIDYYQKALALDTTVVEAKLRLGDLYEGLGDSTMAKMYYQEFVNSAPMIYLDDINRAKAKLEKYR